MLVANIRICKSHLNIREGSDYCLDVLTLDTMLTNVAHNVN